MTKEEVEELIKYIEEALFYYEKDKVEKLINKYLLNTEVGNNILSYNYDKISDDYEEAFEEYFKEFADHIKKLIPDNLMKYYISKCTEIGFEDELLYEQAEEVEKLVNCKDDNKKIEALDGIEILRWKIKIIQTIQEDVKLLEALNKFTPEELITVRQTTLNEKFIKNHINFFIKKEGAEGKVSLDLMENLHENNESLYKNVDFKILSEKYISLLDESKINLITCYPEIQQKFLELTDNELGILTKCINRYMEKNETAEWTIIFEVILEKIYSGEYKELFEKITNLDDLSNEDIDNLIQILQDENKYEIKEIEQIKIFDNIRKEKCNEVIKSEQSTLDEKKNALLQKIFGHDLNFAKKIIKMYGVDIENVEDGEIKDYVRCLKEIEKIEDETILEKIFEECEFVKTDRISLERSIKTEYGNMYTEGLYEPKDSDLDEEFSDQNVKVYNAGVDFKMLLHVTKKPDKWNRPKINVQHFCASYIRNDMIGLWNITEESDIALGFSKIRGDALMASGNRDIGSETGSGISISGAGATTSTDTQRIIFYTPNEQINNTYKYNEMDYRFGEDKIQPDYIVIVCDGKKECDINKAKKISIQFGNIPIVIVEREKCLANERRKVDDMLEEYSRFPNIDLAKAIEQKVRNNRWTKRTKDIWNDLNTKLKDIRNNDSVKVEEKDLRENYSSITTIERQKEVSRIRNVYKKIREAMKADER